MVFQDELDMLTSIDAARGGKKGRLPPNYLQDHPDKILNR